MEHEDRGGKRLRHPTRQECRRRRRRRIALLAVLALLLTGAVAAAVCLLPGGGDPGLPPGSSAAAGLAEPEEAGPVEEPLQEQEEPQPPEGTEEEPQPQETEEADGLDRRAAELLNAMSLRERVLQMFIVTPEQLTGVSGPVTQSGETSRQAIQANPVGGVVYFADNIQTPEQCTAMIAGLQSYSPLGLFIAVDEEGGSVARLGRNSAMGMTQYTSMSAIGDTGDAENAYAVGTTIGTEIARYGFNLDFAPVADVNSNPDNPVIGTRSFSSDAQTAAEMVAACVRGFEDSGILCTLKHFPGHGDTAADSHYGQATSEKTLEELEACEFLPFQAGIEAGAQLVMVGHIALPGVTGDDTPASLSYEITTGLLREQLGFDGVAVTDAMNMQAITNIYSSGQAAVKAIQAGVDIVLMPVDLPGAVDGVLAAVESGELTQERIDESVLRILRLKLEQGIIPMEDA